MDYDVVLRKVPENTRKVGSGTFFIVFLKVLCYTEQKHYSSKNHMAIAVSDYLFSILMRSQCFSNSLINKSSEVLERKKMPPAILHKEVCICV